MSSAISAPNGRKDVNGTLDSFDASNIVEVNEEEIHLDDGSEEMSVAIDLAKLSQGHFSHNDFKNSGYVQFYLFIAYLTLFGTGGETFITLFFLDQIVSADFFQKLSNFFGGENWHKLG